MNEKTTDELRDEIISMILTMSDDEAAELLNAISALAS